jgi:hypothetical protein
MSKTLLLGLLMLGTQIYAAINCNDGKIDKLELLRAALWRGKIELLDSLIKTGINVDHFCLTWALRGPAQNCLKVEMVKMLLKAGVNPNYHASNIWGDGSGCGLTALMVAVKNQNYWAAKILIEAGANINATDKRGNTALHYWIPHNYGCGTGTDAKCNLFSTNSDWEPEIAIFNLIVQAGADINIRNSYGLSAYDIACKTCAIECLEIFQNYFKEQEAKKSSITIQNNTDNSLNVLHTAEIPAHSKAVITTEISKI